MGALLVCVAGVLDLRRPGPVVRALADVGIRATPVGVRTGAAGALVIAVVALGGPGGAIGRVAAGLLGGLYVGFTAFVVLALARGRSRATCGCFGGDETPPSVVHAVVDMVLATASIVVAVMPADGLPALIAGPPAPGSGVALVALVGATTVLALVALTVLPRTLGLARG
ncbi:MAG TPA: MauE/DoxX family redox-associated membrane protein [Acidimicrobiia bacterium]|nr:MauE/DoxX family redox-associated membrane protein [Acidimicrobiia bacterium]